MKYRFKVRGVNTVGNGAESPESDEVTPAPTVPLAPNKPVVVSANKSAYLQWSEKTGGDGGSTITKWEYIKKVGAGNWEAQLDANLQDDG